MKGFGIEIKNNLLEPKHREAMAESIWLYMWFLDKMTSVSEEGIGKVLGGKPIKYDEVNQELKVPRRTYCRWVERLERGVYINVKRTPYGLIVSVNKAFKRFGRVAKSGTTGLATDGTSHDKSGTSKRYYQVGTSNKTITAKDNNSIDTRTRIATPSVADNEIQTLIELFKDVNPSYKQFFSNTTERACLARMLKEHGREKLTEIIKVLPKTNNMDFAPIITSPFKLEKKLGDLLVFIEKEKSKIVGKKIITL